MIFYLYFNYHRSNSVINTFVCNMRWFCKLYSYTRCKRPCRLFENNCIAIIFPLLEYKDKFLGPVVILYIDQYARNRTSF